MKQSMQWVVAAAFAAVSGTALSAGVPQWIHPVTGATQIDPARFLALKADERRQFVVVMSESSIATARARSPLLAATPGQRETLRTRVAAQHETVRPAIESRGGKVLANFHSALNGIKVEIGAREAASLASLPGVVSVLPVGRYQLVNATGVPFIGTPAVWSGDPGFRGEHVKIAILDTGIDYTHADFGGPGTSAAFAAAKATDTLPADPALFGPNAPKVKGGIDLVGDAYDANVPGSMPVVDPNPLDCYGHGSHVAGTAAGFGVTTAGATYHGPYDASIYGSQNFAIGPGVAPQADLYAVRVFGCAGTTSVVTEAIDWAVQNDMDVISMSLGSSAGASTTSDALAASNAAAAGVIVVAASGNDGPIPYITSDPGSGDGVISVAAADARTGFPAAILTPSPGAVITTQDSNGGSLPSAALQVYVLPDTLGTGAGGVSLGCDPAEYDPAKVGGKLVVTVRGTCARVDRAIYGQASGAAAVAMINSQPGYPPFEGAIQVNPDTGANVSVTIPFLGVLQADGPDLVGASNATLAAALLANPGFRLAAGFSSYGPRNDDSSLKPNVTAPGVSVVSAWMGSGNLSETMSGTSMATPHVAGVSALARQAHPGWSEQAVAAAVVETADPDQLLDYAPIAEGAGLVQPQGAVRTHAVVIPRDNPTATSVSFGFAEFSRDYRATQVLDVLNDGNEPITFNITATPTGSVPHNVTLSRNTVRVDGQHQTPLAVTVNVPAATVGSTHDAYGNDTYQDVAGYLTLTPAQPGMNHGVTLHVPYYLVPRARSNVGASATHEVNAHRPQGTVQLANRGGAIAGNGDFYAWGLSGTRQGVRYFDVRAAGVQSNPVSATDSVLVFAINSFDRVSAPFLGEFDVLIDVNGDGIADYDVFSADYGLYSSGSFSGQVVVFIYEFATHKLSATYLADAPIDGSTVLLPVFASSIGLSPSNSRFTYQVQYYNNWDGSAGAMPGTAAFDVFNPSISTAMYVPVAPGARASVPFQVDPAQWATTPALGLMVVVEDNASGDSQARLLPVRVDE